MDIPDFSGLLADLRLELREIDNAIDAIRKDPCQRQYIENSFPRICRQRYSQLSKSSQRRPDPSRF